MKFQVLWKRQNGIINEHHLISHNGFPLPLGEKTPSGKKKWMKQSAQRLNVGLYHLTPPDGTLLGIGREGEVKRYIALTNLNHLKYIIS